MIYFFLFLTVLSIFSSSLMLLFFINSVLYIYLFENGNYLKFHQFVSKYFYFLITIFVSYVLLAFFKNSYIIFVEYVKEAIVLTLKIFIIVCMNIILIEEKSFLNKLPESLRNRVDFIIKIFNFSLKEIKKYAENINKKDLILKIDSIITFAIISTIKKSFENEI